MGPPSETEEEEVKEEEEEAQVAAVTINTSVVGNNPLSDSARARANKSHSGRVSRVARRSIKRLTPCPLAPRSPFSFLLLLLLLLLIFFFSILLLSILLFSRALNELEITTERAYFDFHSS